MGKKLSPLASPQQKSRYLSVPKRHELLLEYTKLTAIPRSLRPPNAVQQLCNKFGVERTYAAHLANRAKTEAVKGMGISLQDKPRSGRPPKLTAAKKEEIKKIARDHKFLLPSSQLARKVGGISKSTICNLINDQGWRETSLRSRPLLSQKHKETRLKWALQNRNQEWNAYVDIDEKYFESVPLNTRIRVPPGEPTPRVPVVSRSNVKKLMVLSAVARPRPDYGFDGKIGIWRITTTKVAKRKSKNHAAGDAYEVDGTMDAASFRRLMFQKVLPTVRRKMKWTSSIVIQMDNAKPHIGRGNIPALLKAGKGVHRTTRKVSVVCQPPQSPDTNVLDLCLFRSLSKRLASTRTNALEADLEGMMESLKKIWNALPADTLDRAYKTKTRVLESIINLNGDNDYVLPHA